MSPMMKKIRRLGIVALLFFLAASVSLYFVSRNSLPSAKTSPRLISWSPGDSGEGDQEDFDDQMRREQLEYEATIKQLKLDIDTNREAVNKYEQLVRELREEVKKQAAGQLGNTTAKSDRMEALVAENYMGCYTDVVTDRDLPELHTAFTMHPAKCITSCRDRGAKFAGLQDGGECWCGNNSPRYAKLDDSECGKRCTGDSRKFCGGSSKNSIYKTADVGFEADRLEIRPFNLQTASSSVFCQGHNYDTRVCKFRNLYFDTTASAKGTRHPFIFYRGPGTIISNADDIRNGRSGQMIRRLLEFTSISGMHQMDLIIVDLPPLGAPIPEAEKKYLDFDEVHVVSGVSALFSRFLSVNIFHHIHDDLMNVFMTMMEYTAPTVEARSSMAMFKGDDLAGNVAGSNTPFDMRTRLMLVDDQVAGYVELTQYLSNVPVAHISEIARSSEAAAQRAARDRGALEPPASTNVLVRFDSAITGVTRHCNWYQYGFSGPQGPIEGKEVDGFNVRLFANHVLQRIPPLTRLPASVPLVLDQKNPDSSPRHAPAPPETGEIVTDPAQRYLAIFSRTRNRRILNEPELVEALQAAYPHLKVVIVRLEETPLPTLIRVMERTEIAVGIHGSLLILGIFLPRDALLVEMYPYGVPANNYTPYRTMSNNKNMGIKYAAWMNSYIENTVGHPQRHRLLGGIDHLAKSKQDEIMQNRWVPLHKCCEDPNWLYRIFQDTKVHVPEVLKTIEELRTR